MGNTRQTSTVTKTQEDAINALIGERPMAYHAAIARAAGSVTAGVLLSLLLSWQIGGEETDGWVCTTQEQIYDETALTRVEQEKARKVLRRRRLLEEKKAGVPVTLSLRVDVQQLIAMLGDGASGDSPSGSAAPAGRQGEASQDVGHLCRTTEMNGGQGIDRDEGGFRR